MRPVITVIEPEGPESWFGALEGIGEVRYYYPEGPLEPEVVSSLLEGSWGVVITSSTAISAKQLALCPDLRIIAKCGGPPSNVDIEGATKCGIAVSCVPGANTTSIAEYAVMGIIACLRGFDAHLDTVKRGRWRTPTTLLGNDLRDATVGIVGLGAIGKEVLRKLEPFDCNVLIYSPHSGRDVPLPSRARFVDSLEEMLPQCDAVSLHCKVTPDTQNMFSERAFSLMKDGAVFVNTARGALVDEDALEGALLSGKLACALIDVFKTEPLPESSGLVKCPNAMLTPHSSGWTHQALWRECDGAVRSVLAMFEKEPIPGLLNPDYIENAK